jgi:hypothetical protein
MTSWRSAHAVHTASRVEPAPLSQGERLDMVLLENHAMWEKLRKRVQEFIELKFVNVEQLGLSSSRISVVFLIRCRDQKTPSG